MNGFNEFLHAGIERGGFTTEDTLASFLPLLRQVVSAHAEGETAPLQGVESLQVETGVLWYEEALRKPPTLNWDDVRRLEPDPFAMLEVVSETRRTTNVDDDDEVQNLLVGDGEQPLTKLVYLPRYSSWEQAIGHHDPISDVFSLGMILASIACGIDLNERTNLERFVECRGNLFRLNPSLHPVLARAITRMTDLDRLGRPQDLQPVLKSLENYRDQEVDLEIDLAQIEGFETGDRQSKQQMILGKLQERLFEISRRNRLLHFKSTMQTLDLTQASVPLAFDVSNLRAEQILSWSGAFRKSVLSGKAFSLNKHLNFEEALYLPSTLDRIRTESQRDKAEYGFEQLRLVLCFLRWTNLKESPVEFYESPLVLLPVTLTKKKGIRDTHWLRPIADEAEVNPVVRYQFKQLYDIDLPETVPLTEESLDELHSLLVAQIANSDQAVHLEKIDKPRIELTHDRARRRLDQYRRKARIAGKGIRSFLDNDYSYDPANYHPLGIKLFNSLVRPPTTHLREIIQKKPRPRSFAVPDKQPPVVETEKSFFHLKQSEEGNPYAWEFDLCGVTLGNFKYRW